MAGHVRHATVAVKKKEMTMSDPIEAAAREIAADLFTDAFGFHADRLAMVDEENRLHSGWCERAVEDRVRRILAKHFAQPLKE
jgi:hypothetical protein